VSINGTRCPSFPSRPHFKKWSIIAGCYVYNKIQTEIAERLQVSRQYVSKVINQYKLEGKFIDKRSTNGRHNKVMSEHSNDTLTGLVTVAPNVNLGDMKKLIEDIEGIPVLKTTIHRTLSELGFICEKPSEKPPCQSPNY